MRAAPVLILVTTLGCPAAAPSVAGFGTPCVSDDDCAGVCARGLCRRGDAPDADAGPAFDASGFGYRVRVEIINPTDERLEEVPFVLRFDAAQLQPGAAADDGRDVRVVGDDGRVWPHEIVAWPAAGERVLWARAPVLEPQPVTGAWLYYDAPEAEDAADGRHVFGSGYRGVWHLDDAPVGVADDVPEALGAAPATSENMDGSALVTGEVGGALAFDGVDDRLRADGWQAPADAFTIQLWVRFDEALDNTHPRRDLLYGGGSGRPHVTFNREGEGRIRLHINVDGAAFDDVATDATSWVADRWTFLAFTFDGAAWRTYVDGEEAGPSRTHEGTSTAPAVLYFGATSSGQNPLPGALDEVHVSDVARSAAWIDFQHATQFGDLATLPAAPEALAQ